MQDPKLLQQRYLQFAHQMERPETLGEQEDTGSSVGTK